MPLRVAKQQPLHLGVMEIFSRVDRVRDAAGPACIRYERTVSHLFASRVQSDANNSLLSKSLSHSCGNNRCFIW